MLVQISCADVLQCDVLIIGGGATALVAALEARKAVDDVVIVCKGKVGRSGNTIVSAAQFAVSDPDSPDSIEGHFQDTLLGGQGINDEALARLLASQVGQRHDILMENLHLGRTETFAPVRFHEAQKTGQIVRAVISGHTGENLTV